jgi:hypothetical protein
MISANDLFKDPISLILLRVSRLAEGKGIRTDKVHLTIVLCAHLFNSPIYSHRAIAVAERGDHPQIHVYDLKSFRRKKTMTAADTTMCKVSDCSLREITPLSLKSPK